MLICAVSLGLVLTAPFFYRHVRGNIFFRSGVSLDRQFDPYDPKAASEDSHNQSHSAMTRTGIGAWHEPLYADPFAEISFAALPEVAPMGYTQLPRGPIPAISAGGSGGSSGGGSSWERYKYDDRIKPIY